VEQSLGLIRAHHKVGGRATGTLAANRNIIRIAIEV